MRRPQLRGFSLDGENGWWRRFWSSDLKPGRHRRRFIFSCVAIKAHSWCPSWSRRRFRGLEFRCLETRWSENLLREVTEGVDCDWLSSLPLGQPSSHMVRLILFLVIVIFIITIIYPSLGALLPRSLIKMMSFCKGFKKWLTWTRAGSMPMARHLLYLQAMHFLLARLMSQVSPAPAPARHRVLSLRVARRRKNALQE